MVPPLAPNRIHSVPVLVSYHLQSSSQTFSTLFPTPQQVYVHPSAGLASSADGEEDEAWGAIYLKAVAQGIVMASPEVHPKHPQTPDLSLYVLDPRETFLRRSRATEPAAGTRASHARSQEVWTGKGLLSWALDEPGVGKNLITGRLCRRREFNTVTEASIDTTMSPLEALAAAHASGEQGDAAWGIEISVGLKSSISAAVGFPGPLHHTIESGQVAGVADVASSPVAPRSHERQLPPVQRSAAMAARTPSTSHLPPLPQSAASRGAAAFNVSTVAEKQPVRGKGGRRKKEDSTLNEVKVNLLESDSIKSDTMTPDQAQRLLSNPTFVSMLKNIVQAPASAQPSKRPRGASFDIPKSAPAGPSTPTSDETCCWNCHTTRSSVWRTKQIDGGKSVRVCNACGLYYNKKRVMRPDKLWYNNADDVKGKAKQGKSTTRADRVDKGFKRTLTMAADKDAQRIANLRSAARKTEGPVTSPVRGSAAASRTLRNSARLAATAAASSPGWTHQPVSTTLAAANAAPTPDSPGSALRRVLGNDGSTLAMPLSDDGNGPVSNSMDWNADLSAFFNVDGFAMDSAGVSKPNLTSPAREAATTDLNNVSSVTKLRDLHELSDMVPAQSDDDVFSQLFNRTSSFGQFESSPTPFDFSQLPPSSPPALPSTLPHSALLYSSPGGSPLDPSPRDSDSGAKPSPPHSNLRHSVTATDAKEALLDTADNQAMQDFFSKLTSGNVSDELVALFASFPAAG